MLFEWDESKSRRNLAERGFDFGYATQVFADPDRLERIDTRRNYGEERRQTVGAVADTILFVAFTLRGEAIRIISARRADEHETEAYHEGAAWK